MPNSLVEGLFIKQISYEIIFNANALSFFISIFLF